MKLPSLNMVFLLFTLFCACEKTKKPNKILQATEMVSNAKITKSITAVVIINKNTCPTCNKEFSEFISRGISRSDILFIITVHPNSFDISPYLTDGQNIYFDDEMVLAKQGLISSSTVLILNSGRIDTMIEIEAKNINSSIEYLEKRLELY